MELANIIVFAIGYLLITLEHPVKINKTATALITGVLCWTLFVLAEPMSSVTESSHYESHIAGEESVNAAESFRQFVVSELGRHLSSISEILFFLMGAMTIVELIDAHHGFRFITDKIKTSNARSLLWIICLLSFFLSAILDNLTTTIVMVTLVRKLIPEKEMKLLFIGMIVISSNAGGAWTPIGDVTTTMLWIGGQITTLNIMKSLFVPSFICMLLPLLFVSSKLKSDITRAPEHQLKEHEQLIGGGRLMLILGLIVIILIPVFKVVTGLPPYIGMLAGLGILWVVSEFIHPELDDAVKKNYTAAGALSRIDVPSVLFFLGILLAVSALESLGTLAKLSSVLNSSIGDNRIIIFLIGIFSAVVDNVPLVAAAMGMYSLETFPTDHFIWQYLAYCAGTGGSMLIIGSAAGVAAMGMEKIDFIWYLKKISWLALLGYVGGAVVFLLMSSSF